MKMKLFVIGIPLMLLSLTTLWAQPPNFSRAVLSRNQSAPPAFLALSHYPALRFVDSLKTTAAKRERSAGKALLFSAALPGAGQFYNKSFLKGLAFAGIEIGAWAVNAIYTRRGNKKTAEFEQYARGHWSEDRYWESLAQHCNCGGDNRRQCAKDCERQFSHFLPDTRNQTYYENIGKYDQFNAGWDDSKSGLAFQRDSERRELYTRIRKTANDQFRQASYGASVVLINHVLSMVEAAYSTRRFNRTQAKATMGMEIQKYDRELAPALSLRMSW